MEQAGLYSMRVILFERDGVPFRAASHYPPQSVAAFGSHDLPPFHGWWRQHRGDEDGRALGEAIGATGDQATEASVAMHRFLGGCNAKLALAQLDDLAGEETQINVPGTTVERPNWRRRLSHNAPDTFADAQASRVVEAISKDRKRQAD
jgi:4-alpha-glucanotransferase